MIKNRVDNKNLNVNQDLIDSKNIMVNKIVEANKNLGVLPVPDFLLQFKNLNNKLSKYFEKLIKLYTFNYSKDSKSLNLLNLSFSDQYFENFFNSSFQNKKIKNLRVTQDKNGLKIKELNINYKLFEKYLRKISKQNIKINITEILTILLHQNLIIFEFNKEFSQSIKLSELISKINLSFGNRNATILILLFKKSINVNVIFDLTIDSEQSVNFLNIIYFLEENTTVNFEKIQNIKNDDIFVCSEQWFLAKSANLKYVSKILSSGKLINYQTFSLEDFHANIENYNKLILWKNSRSIFTVNQQHNAYSTNSVSKIKSVVTNASFLNTSGIIEVNQNAVDSMAEQRHDSLLLDKQAIVTAQPALQVKANKIRCKHGSAISSLSEDDLWYLKSRGMTQSQAKKVLLQAFLGLDNLAVNNLFWLNSIDNIVKNS